MNNPERLHSNQYDEGINAFESMAKELRVGQDKEPERDPVAQALSECLESSKVAVGHAGESFKTIHVEEFYDAVEQYAEVDMPDETTGASMTPGKIAAFSITGIATGVLSAATILSAMNALGLADDPDINGGIFEAAFFSGLFIPYGISEHIEKVKNGEAEPLGDSLAHFFNNLVNRGRN